MNGPEGGRENFFPQFGTPEEVAKNKVFDPVSSRVKSIKVHIPSLYEDMCQNSYFRHRLHR